MAKNKRLPNFHWPLNGSLGTLATALSLLDIAHTVIYSTVVRIISFVESHGLG